MIQTKQSEKKPYCPKHYHLLQTIAHNYTLCEIQQVNSKDFLGFVALSASEVLIDNSKKPVVLVDLLIVNNKYRSTVYVHLDNSKVSQLLLEYTGSKFYDVREHIGISYLILYPDGGKDNKILVDFYKLRGFPYATNKHEWMYVKL